MEFTYRGDTDTYGMIQKYAYGMSLLVEFSLRSRAIVVLSGASPSVLTGRLSLRCLG